MEHRSTSPPKIGNDTKLFKQKKNANVIYVSLPTVFNEINHWFRQMEAVNSSHEFSIQLSRNEIFFFNFQFSMEAILV